MSHADEFLKNLADSLQAEANEKIKKAMQLFIKCDNSYKSVVICATGFSGPLTAKNLRDHFDTLDLMDMLDDLIADMEDDIAYEAANPPPPEQESE